MLLLAGDVGGTKTNLCLMESHTHAETGQLMLEKRFEARYVSRDFFDLVPMVQTFFTTAAAKLGQPPQPETACFGIAGPVFNDTSPLTNLNWSLNARDLEQDLKIPRVTLINDFVAVGYGVLSLDPAEIHTLQVGESQPKTPIGVIGAGTGLGEGFLIPQGNDYQVFGTEGGHTDFAPRNETEFQLLKYLQDKFHVSRISVERVVSGQGIVAIYQFLRDSLGSDHPSAGEATPLGQLIRTWEQRAGQEHKEIDPAAEIAKAAEQNHDYLAEKTLQFFWDAYGAEAGNFTLKVLPFGGLYIAGGVAAKNLSSLIDSQFLKAFKTKGRLSPLDGNHSNSCRPESTSWLVRGSPPSESIMNN
jgi:glucokinase